MLYHIISCSAIFRSIILVVHVQVQGLTFVLQLLDLLTGGQDSLSKAPGGL